MANEIKTRPVQLREPSRLRRGLGWFGFISIATVLRTTVNPDARSVLYTESGGDKRTYFTLAQAQLICRAIQELHASIERETAALRQTARAGSIRGANAAWARPYGLTGSGANCGGGYGAGVGRRGAALVRAGLGKALRNSQ